MRIYFNDKGQRVAYGILEIEGFVGFDVDEKDVLRTVAIIENGKVVDVLIDESIVIDPATNEPIPEGAPTLDERLEVLESENADLWYENILLTAKVAQSEQEIADLWYQVIVGGVSNE